MWTLTGLYRVQSSPRYSYDIVGGLRALDISQRLGFALQGSIGNLPPGSYILQAYFESGVDGSVQSLDDHAITVR